MHQPEEQRRLEGAVADVLGQDPRQRQRGDPERGEFVDPEGVRLQPIQAERGPTEQEQEQG